MSGNRSLHLTSTSKWAFSSIRLDFWWRTKGLCRNSMAEWSVASSWCLKASYRLCWKFIATTRWQLSSSAVKRERYPSSNRSNRRSQSRGLECKARNAVKMQGLNWRWWRRSESITPRKSSSNWAICCSNSTPRCLNRSMSPWSVSWLNRVIHCSARAGCRECAERGRGKQRARLGHRVSKRQWKYVRYHFHNTCNNAMALGIFKHTDLILKIIMT